MTKYLMCIYWWHICIFIPNMKFLSLILWLGGLCDDANDTDNYARQTKHAYIGSFGIYTKWAKNHGNDRNLKIFIQTLYKS